MIYYVSNFIDGIVVTHSLVLRCGKKEKQGSFKNYVFVSSKATFFC